MTKFEKVNDVISELEEHKKNKHVYVKKDGYCYRVKEIYVDDDGDVILQVDEE